MMQQLDEIEKEFKRQYLNGGKSYVEHPMTYAEYAKLRDEGICMCPVGRDYYKAKSKNQQGITVEALESIFALKHPRYSYPVLHNHAYVELIYVLHGNLMHCVEEKTFPMKQGDLCILAPNAMHALMVADDETIALNVLISKNLLDNAFMGMLRENKLLRDFFENILYNKCVTPYIIFRTGEDVWLETTFELLMKEEEKKSYAYKESMQLYMEQIFIHLIRQYEMFAVVSNPMDASFNDSIVSILGYISVNYNRVDIRQVADFFGYSESYVGKLIKKYTGKTFMTILNELQMDHARKLLLETNQSVTDICQEVGCFDSSHLTKKFKKMYGETPVEFRKWAGVDKNI